MIENLAALRESFAFNPPRLSSHFDADDPRGLRPLSLEQQKKRAKEWLRHEKLTSQTPPKLSEAQHIIARENGFANWAQMKAHIEHSQIARSALRDGKPQAPDGKVRTLHIRCGTDIRHTLAVAGFVGDFLPFYDPYPHGPLPEGEELDGFLRIRADFLAQGKPAYADEIFDGLKCQYAALEQTRDYASVHLWFEHDSYDQLILAKLLDYFRDSSKRPASVKLISVSRYPGVQIFNGIGQLPPEALRVLWRDFREVSTEQFELGSQVWSALRSPAPGSLRRITASGTPELPTMAIALARHLEELPSEYNGLNLSENLTLRILSDKGAMNASRLFGWYANHYEPLPFMGDSFFWRLLEGLANVPHPAITSARTGEDPKQWQLGLTAIGERLLSGRADWVELNGIDRWVGGIHLDSGKGKVWRNSCKVDRLRSTTGNAIR
ncbi:MAG: DUF1835 domain-containing protein [Chromatiales bacterium]|nr:DUF1835 domain-containing protein [Chromatiales bacterium]